EPVVGGHLQPRGRKQGGQLRVGGGGLGPAAGRGRHHPRGVGQEPLGGRGEVRLVVLGVPVVQGGAAGQRDEEPLPPRLPTDGGRLRVVRREGRDRPAAAALGLV